MHKTLSGDTQMGAWEQSGKKEEPISSTFCIWARSRA
jgi:hypothetical protein